MKSFRYQARDNTTNKVIKATIKAESEIAAGKSLLEQGLIPIVVKEESESDSFFSKIKDRITLKDRLILTRQLSTLINAGLPISQSLRTVFDQTENKRLKAIVGEIISSVEGGHPLSEAFAKNPEVFDKLFVSLVAAGEISGTMDEALKRVAAQQEKDAQMMSKVKGALTYPAIVLVVITGVVAFMMFAVIPQVEGLYRDMKMNLPLITKIMVLAANFLINYWWLLLIILGIGIYFLRQYLITEAGREAVDKFKLNVPLFKKMFRKLYMARFTRTGQTLLSTGVPMLDSLDICADAVNNHWIGDSIKKAAEKVKGGKALSAALKPEDYILPLVPQMIRIGEQSGKIDEMLGKTAQIYEEELDEEIKALSTAIEPILMVVLAVVAGSMTGAILIPIYGMVNNVRV